MSVNKAIILGNIGNINQAETRGNSSRLTFSVATNKHYKDRGGNKQQKTTWHRIVTWGTLAKNCHQYLRKGMEVYIEGEMESYEHEGKRYFHVTAAKVEFLGKKNAGGEGSSNGGSFHNPELTGEVVFDDDDIPF